MLDAGTQRARPSQHCANVTGAWVGPVSHDRLHAPVAVPSSGLKHGEHFSVALSEDDDRLDQADDGPFKPLPSKHVKIADRSRDAST